MTSHADNLRGASLMIASMACFTVGDAFVKLLGASLPLPQLLFLRGCVATVFIAALAWRLGQIRLRLPGRDWRLIGIRTLAETGAAFFFLSALLNMPLANATALIQTLPLALTVAGAVFLKEPVGWRRWSAIAIGFIGMMLIVRPGTDGFNIWSLYALAAVLCVTVRDLAVRRMSVAVPSLTVTLAASLGVLLFAALWSTGVDWAPVTARDAGLVMACAICITGGYAFSVAVMRVGDIGFVSPFRYTGLIWALVLGFLFFGEWPEPVTLLGAAIICGTGVFTLIRSARRR